MKRCVLALAAGLFLGLCCTVSARAVDGLPARHQYTLDFELDMVNKQYSGTETILVVNHSTDDWERLLLRDYATVATLIQRRSYRNDEGREVFLEPNADSARITGLRDLSTGEALDWQREENDPSMVWVDLNAPLKPGEAMELSFSYSADLYWGRGNLCWKQEGKNTYVNLGNFYPILSVYEDGAWQGEPYHNPGEYFYSPISDYYVTLTAPKSYVVAASAAGTEPEAVGDMLRWSYEGKEMRDFALCLSDGFAVLTGDCGGVEVRSYFIKGEEAIGERQLEAAIECLSLFGALFGYPYPYETYSSVKGIMDSGGMEFPGLVIADMPVDLSRAEDMVERDMVDFLTVVAHETAHQWFYAVVGSNSGLQPWLDEGLARFCELIFKERFYPEHCEAAVRQMHVFTDNYAPHSLNRSVAEMGQGYSSCAYSYGQRFLYELRETMGEDLFYDCLRQYVNAGAMGEAHTEDFVDTFLRECGWDRAVRGVMEEFLFPAYLDMVNDPLESAAMLVTVYGLMEGTAPGRFSPKRAVTRAEAAALCYRLAGEPGVLGYSIYLDVEPGCWYEDAVLWASMEGFFPVQGYFGPEESVTQEAFLSMLSGLWPQLEVSGPEADGSKLTRVGAAVILEQIVMQPEFLDL